MLLVHDYDDIEGISRYIIVGFSLGMIVGAFLIGILILRKMRKTDVRTSRFFLLGIFWFTLLFGLGRLVLLYHDYFAEEPLDIPLWTIGSGLSLAGLTCLTYTIEKFVFTKTKMVISVLGVACIVLLFVLAFLMLKSLATIVLYSGNIAVILVPFLIYIYIAKISTGAVRKQAVIIIIGMVVSFIGQLGGAVLFNLHVLDRLWSQLFGIILTFWGLVFLSYGFVKTPTGA
nr:hypothetical protein [Candidatus Sigynarchaeota archaeon]